MPEYLVRARSTPSEEHGHVPRQRPADELVRLGAVILDKPAGPSSHQVAGWVRDLLGLDKAGHGGTLDPNVTGVLPMALGDATKALAHVKGADKAYVGVIELHKAIDRETLEDGIEALTGAIEQMPPARSAVKRQRRTRQVHRFDLLELDRKRAVVEVECEAGTYVRTLAKDLGDQLGVGAQLAELRRTRSGGFTEDVAVTLHDLKDAWDEWTEEGRDDWLREAVIPVEELVGHLPRIVLRDTAVDAICHGAPLGLPGLLEVDKRIERGDDVLMVTQKGEGVAFGQADMDALEMAIEDTGQAARPTAVLMRTGTYPKGW